MTTMPETPTPLSAIAGQRIRSIRRQRGMSASTLAKVLKWPTETLINFEYSRRRLHLEQLEAIAAALNVSPLALLIADEQIAATVALLATDADLAGEVRFFLNTLAAEEIPPGPGNDIAGSTPL
jgi:transcriptional regulator with XRE-family HTH domain